MRPTLGATMTSRSERTHLHHAPDVVLRSSERGTVLEAPLWYPGVPPDGDRCISTDAVEITLVHVRAARTLRIEYDFERDGYRVQAEVLPPDERDDAPPPDQTEWIEVAFVPAWPPGGAV